MKINIKPLSVNEVWQGRRFKNNKYKDYEQTLFGLLPIIKLPEAPYTLYIKVGLSNKLSDIDNIAKPFIDILQKHYGFNDRYIYKLIIERDNVSKNGEYIYFKFESYKK